MGGKLGVYPVRWQLELYLDCRNILLLRIYSFARLVHGAWTTQSYRIHAILSAADMADRSRAENAVAQPVRRLFSFILYRTLRLGCLPFLWLFPMCSRTHLAFSLVWRLLSSLLENGNHALVFSS